MRRDAAERREKLLDAAEEKFTQKGINTLLEGIAKRAGVGFGTFYRNFPDRQALLDALLERTLDRMEIEILNNRPESGCILIESIAQSLVSSPVLSDYWRSSGRHSEAGRIARERFIRIAEQFMKTEVARNQLREDLVPADIPLISSMLGGILYGQDLREREDIKKRLLSLLYDGILSRAP